VAEGKFVLGGLALLAVWLFFGLPLLYHPIEAAEFLGLGAEGLETDPEVTIHVNHAKAVIILGLLAADAIRLGKRHGDRR
jgi:hypothetical protein